MELTDPKRVVYCIELWRKELASFHGIKWNHLDLIGIIRDEILNGKFCTDKEYNEYLITGDI